MKGDDVWREIGVLIFQRGGFVWCKVVQWYRNFVNSEFSIFKYIYTCKRIINSSLINDLF